jgi:hypothetical protein
MRLLALVVAAAALAAGCAGPAAPQKGPESAPAQIAIPGEYVITVEQGADGRTLAGVLVDLGPTRIQGLGGDRWLVVFAQDPGLTRLSLRTGERIRTVEPHLVSRTSPRTSSAPRSGAGEGAVR